MNMSDKLCSIETIPHNILRYHIFEYLSTQCFIKFSSTNKMFREFIMSPHCIHLWDKCFGSSFSLCIDSYCPMCSLKRHKGKKKSAFTFLSCCPLKALTIHCFISDIPRCLQAVSYRGIVESLHLQLTNKSNSPLLHEILQSSDYLMQSKDMNIFKNLKKLILDSSHLVAIHSAGRELLLDILGSTLISLSCIYLSPSNIFRIVKQKCTDLEHLRVDKTESIYDLIAFSSTKLKSLEIYRANYILPALGFNIPNLESLHFSTNFKCEAFQIETMISNIPKFIKHLRIEVPSSDANFALKCINHQHFTYLESLTLEGSYDTIGNIWGEDINALGKTCPNLTSFELVSLKSVSIIGFESQAFMQLRSLTTLVTLRVMYQDSVLLFLPNLLRQHQSLKHVVLWHRKNWFDELHWNEVHDIVANIIENYPHINISLQEIQ